MNLKLFICLIPAMAAGTTWSQITGCNVEKPNQVLQEITPSLVKKPPQGLKLDGSDLNYPKACKTFRIDYKKNGDVKDSTLFKFIIWNTDGLLVSETEFNRKGEIENVSNYRYEMFGGDSIVTALSTKYGNKRYIFNNKQQVAKYLSANDTSFQSIHFTTSYNYDSDGIFLSSITHYSTDSENEQTWTRVYDSDTKTVTVFEGKKQVSVAQLHSDSCYAEINYNSDDSPFKTVYYFDSNQYITRMIDYSKDKKDVRQSIINFEKDEAGRTIHQYGTYGKAQTAIDVHISYTSDGHIKKLSYPYARQSINYYYLY